MKRLAFALAMLAPPAVAYAQAVPDAPQQGIPPAVAVQVDFARLQESIVALIREIGARDQVIANLRLEKQQTADYWKRYIAAPAR